MRKLMLMIALMALPLTAQALSPSQAINSQQACKADRNLVGCSGSQEKSILAPDGMVHNVANALLLVAGAVAALFTIIGGLKYTLSAGDPSSIKAAKDTVLYAAIGLVVAMLAASIVNFVLFKVG